MAGNSDRTEVPNSGDTDRGLPDAVFEHLESIIGAVEELCRRHPEHEKRLWRELADAALASEEPLGDDVEVVGPYEIRGLLGHGGMGRVYRARHRTLGREVALKIMRSDLQDSAGFEGWRHRFERERRELSRLESPYFCKVYEVGEQGGTPYMALNLVRGENLARKIRRAAEDAPDAGCVVLPAGDQDDTSDGASSHETAVGGARARRAPLTVACFFEHAARALHLAHDAGLVHRDIKPSNIMVTPEGTPVLLDFGLARDTREDRTQVTLPGELVGTVGYMAPEQVRGEALDRRTDVWALGVCLYEALCLEHPFPGVSDHEVFEKILQTDPARLPRRTRAVPRDLEIVVSKAMDKDPSRRYATAAELADDLRRVRSLQPIRARPATVPFRIQRWIRRNPLAALLIASISVGLLISLWQFSRAEASLTELRVMADVTLLPYLLQQAETELWPAHPDNVPAMRRWLRDTEGLVARRGSHAAKLAELERRLARKAGGAAVETLRSRHGAIRTLLSGIDALGSSDPAVSALASVRARLADATALSSVSIDAHRSRWSTALLHIANEGRCPEYAGYEMPGPQLGLVPLGRDRDSGLWEFWHVLSGERPTWEGEPLSGKVRTAADSGIVLVLLPGGTFSMGAQQVDASAPDFQPGAQPAESPVTDVRLAPFFMSKFEMTQAQWHRAMGDNPSLYESAPPGLLPVEQVDWLDCSKALRRLGLTLPTEAQWEYAARAGTTTAWWTGSTIDSLAGGANVADAAARRVHPPWPCETQLDDGCPGIAPVGLLRANAFGLHDVLGNVWEWCRDAFGPYDVPPEPGDGFRKQASDKTRVFRGGSFMDMPPFARCTVRYHGRPRRMISNLGVRPARPVEANDATSVHGPAARNASGVASRTPGGK